MLALQLLGIGYASLKVIEEMKLADPYHKYRQFAVVDKDGNAIAYTGPKVQKWNGFPAGSGYVAAGNVLGGPRVIEDMSSGFEGTCGQELEERLVRVIEAGG